MGILIIYNKLFESNVKLHSFMRMNSNKSDSRALATVQNGKEIEDTRAATTKRENYAETEKRRRNNKRNQKQIFTRRKENAKEKYENFLNI